MGAVDRALQKLYISIIPVKHSPATLGLDEGGDRE